MPYIAFELDALNAAPDVAGAAGIGEEFVIAGLLRLWARCFRFKTDAAEADHIAGCFRVEDPTKLARVLVSYGFLEAREGDWRVRGADRYLRLSAARSKGGKAAVQNLKQYQNGATGTAPAVHRLQPDASRTPAGGVAGAQPDNLTGSTPALTPSTEHHKRSLSAPGTSLDLLEDLAAVYAERHNRRPRWGVSEARTLEPVLADGPDEVLRRWRIALWWVGWPTCRTVKDLVQHWDRYVAPQEQRLATTQRNTIRADPDAGIPRAPPETRPCELCGTDADTGVFWDRWLCTRHQGACCADIPAPEFNATTVAAWIQKRREAA